MDEKTLESIFVRVNEYLDENTDETIDLLWHGGEPLLAGKYFFRRAIELQGRHCSNTRQRIHHTIQSNLTLLDQEFSDILHALGVRSIGTSYEPEPGVRGLGKTNDSIRYSTKFHHALRILQNSEMQWGIIYVVNSKSLPAPEKEFYYLTNLLEGRPLSITPVLRYSENSNDYCITPEQYTDFLGKTFRAWWEDRRCRESVQPFTNLYNTLAKKQRSDNCMEFGVCASNIELFEIMPTGQTRQGGVFFNNNSPVKNRPEYGDISKMKISDLLTHDNLHEFEKSIKSYQHDACSDCYLKRYCQQSYHTNGKEIPSMITKSEWCQTRIDFIKGHFLPRTGVSLG